MQRHICRKDDEHVLTKAIPHMVASKHIPSKQKKYIQSNKCREVYYLTKTFTFSKIHIVGLNAYSMEV